MLVPGTEPLSQTFFIENLAFAILLYKAIVNRSAIV